MERLMMNDLFERAKLVDIAQVCAALGLDINPQDQTCCPFHNDPTPSFTIYPPHAGYHCFGCGAHGDVIDLVVKLQGWEPKAAALWLLGESEDALAPAPKFSPSEMFSPKPVKGCPFSVQHVENWAFALQHHAPPLQWRDVAYKQQHGTGLEWLQRVRGIDPHTAAAYRLGYTERFDFISRRTNKPITAQGQFISIPIFSAAQTLVAVEFRNMGTVTDFPPRYLTLGSPCLFDGWQVATNPAPTCFLVENRLNAIAISGLYGMAMGVALPANQFNTGDGLYLAGKRQVVVLHDNDEAGVLNCGRVRQIVGRATPAAINWQFKDIGDLIAWDKYWGRWNTPALLHAFHPLASGEAGEQLTQCRQESYYARVS